MTGDIGCFRAPLNPDAAPGRRSIQLAGLADVDGFEEEQRNVRIEIDVPKPETPK